MSSLPLLTALTSLRASFQYEDFGVATLPSNIMPALQQMTITGDAALEAFVAITVLPALTSLSFTCQGTAGAGFACVSRLTSLKELTMEFEEFDQDCQVDLLPLTAQTKLDCANAPLPASAMVWAPRQWGTTKLRELRLNVSGHISDATVATIAAMPHLRVLGLHDIFYHHHGDILPFLLGQLHVQMLRCGGRLELA